jgi:hypothetical protein
LSAFVGCSVADVISVVGSVCDDKLSRGSVEKYASLWGVTFLAGGEHEANGTSQATHSQMDFGAQAASRASDGLILSPPFAPLACW